MRRTIRLVGVALLVIGAGLGLVGRVGRAAQARPGPVQDVSEDPQVSINSHTSPVAVADPHRPEVLVVAGRIDAPQLNCSLSVSTSGGEAWRRLDLPLAPGAANCFWPDVAFDGDGNLLVLYTPTGGQYNLPLALWLQRLGPDMSPAGPPTAVAGALAFQPRLAVDGRRVLVAWISAAPARADKPLGFPPPPNPLVVTRSDDGGRTFAPPVTVGDPSRLIVQPTLLALPGGRVFVGAWDLGDDLSSYETADDGRSGPPPTNRWKVVTWTSGDGGATFGPAVAVNAEVVVAQRVLIDLAPAPAFAADAARNRIYATWESGHDVFLSRSDDGGLHWAAARAVGPTRGGQFLPGVAVSAGGRVDVAFYDRSRDPGDVQAEVVLATSGDGGRTFSTAVVSDRAFDSTVGSFNGDGSGVMLGSHLGVVSGDRRATVVWADAARGNRVNNIVDLVSSTVDVRPASGARRPLLAAGAALAGLGLGLTALPSSRSGSAPGRRPALRPPAWPRRRRRD